MSYNLILNDWLDYDIKKLEANQTPKKFNCTQAWERFFLAQKIQQHHPSLTSHEITTAIRQCCLDLKTPQNREPFVRLVCLKLNISVFSE